MSLASLPRVLGPRIALGGALLAGGCQHDSNAVFDDTNLPSTKPGSGGEGGSGAVAGGSAAGGGQAIAGSSAGGKASAGSGGGGTASGGGAGGKASGGGAGGKASGGGAGGKGQGGKAGAEAGGTGGAAGKGGTGGGGLAGTGGMLTNPEPMTFETIDIDDADVQSCDPLSNFGDNDPLNPDGSNMCMIDTLISVPLTGVPDGARVSDASLTLTCTDPGGAIVVSYADESWSELKVRWNNRPQVGTMIDNIRCNDVGEVTIDLTAAVKHWLAGDRQNFGIYLRSESSDDTSFASSETDDETQRPKLSVTYTLPVK